MFAFALAAGSCVVPAAAAEMPQGIAYLYESVSIYPPKGNSMTICYGFVCRRRIDFEFTPADRKALGAIMAKGKASAAAERAAVQEAVVWWDKRLGPVLKTTTRIARADFRHRADATNYDCWDTTRNITSLLLLLQQWGHLRHHTVIEPKYRGNWLVGQTPHNTPVMKDRAGGGDWVVDMWTVAYAEKPQVMTVAEWMKED
jgi:hypothetical protein